MTEKEIATFVIVIIILLFVLTLALIIFLAIRNGKYKKFVITNSEALRNLKALNNKYDFYKIPNFDMKNSYDNEHFYNLISPYDYLTYQLVYQHKKINKAIEETLINNGMYKDYTKEIKEKCILGNYGNTKPLKNINKLNKLETKLFNENIKTPTIKFVIKVTLFRTNINGDRLERKSEEFKRADISDLIYRLGQKNGSYYADRDIWDSICKVERGKVSNKIRFAIYKRDGHRCRYCGRHTNDLEIDHIIPISKGGKSTLENLQTLCHRCNVKKGTDIF